MDKMLHSFEDGIRDGFGGPETIDRARQETDPAYAGGVRVGECKFVQFMAITTDYPLDFVPSPVVVDLPPALLEAEEDSNPELVPLELLWGSGSRKCPDLSTQEGSASWEDRMSAAVYQ